MSKLISNIEALSETLSEKQLVQFLDIMDAMTVMVDDAKKIKKDYASQASIDFEVPADLKYLH
ncbi:MAG: hypothetical protein GJ680_10490 [Alteromonadaceae bacterium]|nr:hypothetical protein [Alteromonadaceae bacterium]